jgi:hypothetical protein
MILTITVDLGTTTVTELVAQLGELLVATAQQFTDKIAELKTSADGITASAAAVTTAISDLEAKIGTGVNTGMSAAEEDAALASLADLKASQDAAKAALDTAVASATTVPVPPTPAGAVVGGQAPLFPTSSGSSFGGHPHTAPGSTSNPPPHQGP